MAKHPVRWSEGAVPFSEQFSDHFYNETDGRAETEYVFFQGNDLPERWQSASSFVVGELGFGTGLNFLATWAKWIETRGSEGCLTFVSFEGFPMSAHNVEVALSVWPDLTPQCQALLEKWESLGAGKNEWLMDPQTRLMLFHAEVEEGMASWDGQADAWYLDGFAPARNPDMWSAALMGQVFEHTALGGTFASYTSAGWVRRNLQEAGFDVRRCKGYGRKRHMIAGCKRAETPPS